MQSAASGLLVLNYSLNSFQSSAYISGFSCTCQIEVDPNIDFAGGDSFICHLFLCIFLAVGTLVRNDVYFLALCLLTNTV
jgi:hypothetical protein